jgi:hypothetical protein
MAGQEFQYIQDILKEYYAPAIVNQVYKKAPLWAQIQKSTKGVYGKRIVIPVQLAFTEAVGARVSNDYSLPTAQRNTYDQAYIYMKRNYGRIKVDGFAIQSAKGAGGWVDIVSAESKGVANAFAINLDRQTMCDGSAVLALCVGSASGQVITVDTPGGIVGDTPVTKWFRKGMRLDIYTAAGTKHADSVEIASIDESAGTITITGSGVVSSVTDNDVIYREDVFSATAASLGEMIGLEAIISSSNAPGSGGISAADYEGIDRAANPEWQSYIKTSGGVLTETLIQNTLDSIEVRTDGDTPNLALTTFALRNKLVSLMVADRQVVNQLDLTAGWKAIKYVGGNVTLPFMVHPKCATGYIYLICTPAIKFYTLQDIVWDNSGGGVLKPVAGEDAYESWFKMYGNIGTDCPNCMGKITGVTTT